MFCFLPADIWASKTRSISKYVPFMTGFHRLNVNDISKMGIIAIFLPETKSFRTNAFRWRAKDVIYSRCEWIQRHESMFPAPECCSENIADHWSESRTCLSITYQKGKLVSSRATSNCWRRNMDCFTFTGKKYGIAYWIINCVEHSLPSPCTLMVKKQP